MTDYVFKNIVWKHDCPVFITLFIVNLLFFAAKTAVYSLSIDCCLINFINKVTKQS